MIKPEMVPDEVCLALKETLFSGPGHNIYATALAAALNAWEGASHEQDQLGGNWHRLILPLTENSDDQ